MKAQITLIPSQHKNIHAFDAVYLRVTDAFITYLGHRSYNELAVDTLGFENDNGNLIHLKLRTCA
jgi:hypothetical protein